MPMLTFTPAIAGTGTSITAAAARTISKVANFSISIEILFSPRNIIVLLSPHGKDSRALKGNFVLRLDISFFDSTIELVANECNGSAIPNSPCYRLILSTDVRQQVIP